MSHPAEADAPRSDATPIFDETARLLRSRQVSPDAFELSLRSPRIAAAARAGQFVNVLVPSGGFGRRVFATEHDWLAARPPARRVLVRRPFSIYRAHGPGDGPVDRLDLLVRAIGEGTRRLVATEVGTELRVLGPLGKPFDLPPAGAPAALVAGGCGWASLGLLARELRRRGHPVYAFIGARTAGELPLDTAQAAGRVSFLDARPDGCVTSRELEGLGIVVGLCAEEGGDAYPGLVTGLLARFLGSGDGAGAHVYGCGPFAMLRVVARLAAEHDAPAQLSFEKRMACGIGVCMSCVCEVKDAEGRRAHKRLCLDGPILRAHEVDWSREQG